MTAKDKLDEKQCTKCQETFPIAQFNWRNKAKGHRQSTCKRCQSEKTLEHYRRNKKPYLDRARKRKQVYVQEVVGRVLDYLATHPCVDCGEDDIIVLQFDHRDPAEKKYDISWMLKWQKTWNLIEAEIAKCDVRCANCHVRRTAKENSWKKRTYETHAS